KLLTPAGDSGLPPVLDQIKIEAGYEMALAAALGDDLDAPVAADAPVFWRLNAAADADPALPAGVAPLVAHVDGPSELTRRLRQVQTKVAQTRDVLTAMERQARETEAKIAAVSDAKGRTGEALVEARSHLAETEAALQALGGTEALEADLAAAQTAAADLRS